MQKHFLETSGIGYQCCDNCGEAARRGNACDCIHAITDMDPEYGRENYPLIWFGDPASEHIAHRMRELPETKHALLIAVSGYGRAEDRERARQAGFDHHLVKPTSLDQLVKVIAAHEIRSQCLLPGGT